MKKLKLILFTALLASSFSCLVDDEDPAQEFIDAPSVVNFTNAEEILIFTPTSLAQELSTTVNLYTEIPNNGDLVLNWSLNANETTLAATDYEIFTPAEQTFTIRNGEEVADELFSYKIIPDNLTPGETYYFAVDLNVVSGENVIAGQLLVTVDVCDPVLVGSYTAANTVNGSSNGDGEAVEIIALNCNTYQASNLPNFNSIQFFDFILNDDNTITLTGTLSNFSNLVTGNGVLLPSGTIQIDDFDIQDNAQDMSFDLVPNP